MKTAIELIALERSRQLVKEGWTPENDDKYRNGELSLAAACYAAAASGMDVEAEVAQLWPWEDTWWKPTNPIRNLVKAGALIVADIERVIRFQGSGVVDYGVPQFGDSALSENDVAPRRQRLFGMGWLFGVIDGLEIPGYSLVMTPETFVQAVRANGVPHFVVQTPGGWLLHPKMCKAEFRSEGNPNGEYVNTQIGIYVPRPE